LSENAVSGVVIENAGEEEEVGAIVADDAHQYLEAIGKVVVSIGPGEVVSKRRGVRRVRAACRRRRRKPW
jgi:hypothetical protein